MHYSFPDMPSQTTSNFFETWDHQEEFYVEYQITQKCLLNKYLDGVQKLLL